MRPPPTGIQFDTGEQPSVEWVEWMRQELFPTVSCDNGYGITADRPVNGIKIGSRFFDTTIGKPIWYNGTGWIDAVGNSV